MTEFVYVKGKAKWFRHMAPETYMEKSFWKHTVYPDTESLEIIRDLQAQGLKNKLKKDEDGYYVNFSRPTVMKNKGQVVPMNPPMVVQKDGKTPQTQEVGNGSDITTKLEVYSHNVPGGGKAKAARWLSTRVDNLVVYNSRLGPNNQFDPTEYFDAHEQRAVKGLADQPAQENKPLFN